MAKEAEGAAKEGQGRGEGRRDEGEDGRHDRRLVEEGSLGGEEDEGGAGGSSGEWACDGV